MQLQLNETYLITSSSFFIAPDGRQYRGIFGSVTSVQSDTDTLGIKTNAKSSNWYVIIGNMVIAGCQIMHAIKTKQISEYGVQEESWGDGKHSKFYRETLIYNADREYEK